MAAITASDLAGDGTAAAQKMHDALADAGLPRVGSLTGGEIRGWTKAFGSTGFSMLEQADGRILWHVVLCGKTAGLRYEKCYDHHTGDELYEVDLDAATRRLMPRILAVAEALGLTVVRYAKGEAPSMIFDEPRASGYSTAWDYDVSFNFTTERPM